MVSSVSIIHPAPDAKPVVKLGESGDAVQWRSPLLLQRITSGTAFRNNALMYASDVMRSEAARLDAQLSADFTSIMRGNTVYINNFVCDQLDEELYHSLKRELVVSTGASMADKGGLIEWSRHQVFENPTEISQTFNAIIDMLAEYFDLEVYATRLNYYRDGSQWKPQHHDSHAYGGRAEREDFTVGITLGATRSLVFVHEASGWQFEFPQKNGDCFAFTSEVNQTFTHGVPRVSAPIGDRFSIIAWGRRRSINERNGGGTDTTKIVDNLRLDSIEDAVEAAKSIVSLSRNRSHPAPDPALMNATDPGQARRQYPKKKNRLQ